MIFMRRWPFDLLAIVIPIGESVIGGDLVVEKGSEQKESKATLSKILYVSKMIRKMLKIAIMMLLTSESRPDED